MLPELILNTRYELSCEQVNEEIQNYEFRGHEIDEDKNFEVSRIGGYRYVEAEDGSSDIIGWQCNMADIQNYDIKLPTILQIHITKEQKIDRISLDENFKGSQGIPCSQRYLNRRIKNLISEDFMLKNPKLQDALITGCRHTYEVLFGACAFKEYCNEHKIVDGWLSETTAAYNLNDEIIAYDINSINGTKTISKVVISNFEKNLQYNTNGAICSCGKLKICGYDLGNEEEEILVGEVKYMEAATPKEFRMKIMKILSKYWVSSGKKIGMKSKFYFSHLWPPTFFGILTQMFAIAIFGNSYAYFQHCIRGLQKDEENCACIGVCENIEECQKFFEDFEMEDII